MDEPDLNPVIHQRARLRILAALAKNRRVSFTDLRDGLGLTPGNLDTHTTRLEEAGYLEGFRTLEGSGFEKQFRLTDEGEEAFETYLDRLGELLPDPTDQAGPDG